MFPIKKNILFECYGGINGLFYLLEKAIFHAKAYKKTPALTHYTEL